MFPNIVFAAGKSNAEKEIEAEQNKVCIVLLVIILKPPLYWYPFLTSKSDVAL